MRKKPKVRYVDMAIYIDNNVNKPDADVNKIWDYLVMLSYMLAVKRRFFTREDYYDRFAYYFATIVYNRLTDKRQFEDPNSSNYITPIKSCLNYMKQTIYGRKCVFCNEEFDSVCGIDAETLVKLKKELGDPISNNSHDFLSIELNDCIDNINKIIHDKIYNGVYGKDKSLAWKLYTSVLISLVRNFTLSKSNKKRLIDYKMSNKFNELNGDCRLYLKLNFEELIERIMWDETATAPVAYDLDNSYLDYVALVVQQVKKELIRDIEELNQEYTLSDDLVEDVLMSCLSSVREDEDETD